MDEQEEVREQPFSPKFNDPDADVVFRSSDGVLYRIHSNHLEFTSNGFPPTGFKPDDAHPVDLPEPSKILELMFQFVYPKMRLSLDELDFQSLAALAEAVEKYQIYTGLEICRVYMTQALPHKSPAVIEEENAIAVLEYSIRHGYHDLANQAAPTITMEHITTRLERNTVSPDLVRAWLPYFQKWTNVLQSIITGTHASKPNHDRSPLERSLHACMAWPRYQKDIIAAFAKVMGRSYDPEVAELIVVSGEAPGCCQREVRGWKSEAKELIAGMPPLFG